MKLIHFLTAFFAMIFATMTYAQTPNRTTMTWPEFVEASGCVIVDKGGYSNLASADGGNCPSSVVVAWSGLGQKLVPGPDGDFGTEDDYYTSDN